MNNPDAPGALARDSRNARWRARAILLGVFAVFFVPVLAALWLNAYAPHWQPFGYTNHGELVSPALAVEAGSLSALDGHDWTATSLRERWTLVYVGQGPCGSVCEQALRRMRQVRLALGKDSDRVQRLLLWPNNNTLDNPGRLQLLKQYPGLRLAAAAPAHPLLTGNHKDPGVILLIDPRAFLILRYPAELGASAILKDMQRLLKLAGRE